MTTVQAGEAVIPDVDWSKNNFTFGDVVTDGVPSAPNTSRVQAYRNAAQSIPDYGTTQWNTVEFDTEIIDTLGEHSAGVFTAVNAGSYAVSWCITLGSASWVAAERLLSALSVNNAVSGTDIYNGTRCEAQANYTGFAASNGSAIVYLAAGDTLRIKASQNTGGAVGLLAGSSQSNFMNVHKIS